MLTCRLVDLLTCRPAFTLLEMLVTIAIIAVAAMLAAPMFSGEAQLQVQAASSVLSSDIEMAQALTISFPDQPMVVRLEPDHRTYWLAYASDPETPITRVESGDPYLVVLGQGRAGAAQGVTMTLDQITGNMIQFDSLGGLVDFTATPMIQLERNGAAITLAIAPNTGTISENTGTIEQLQTK